MSLLTAVVRKISNGDVKVPGSLDEFMNRTDRASQIAFGAVAGTSVVVGLKVANKMFGTDPLGRTCELFGKFFSQEKKRDIEVNKWIDEYNNLHDDESTGLENRNASYTTLVNAYYELATLFYEWGWGQSFHFAYQLKGESFKEAIERHEYFLAGKLGVRKGDKVLDCGCGVGGPLRNIARFTRADITGVTLNQVQKCIILFVLKINY